MLHSRDEVVGSAPAEGRWKMHAFAQRHDQRQKPESSTLARSDTANLGTILPGDFSLALQRAPGDQAVRRRLQTHVEAPEARSTAAASTQAKQFGLGRERLQTQRVQASGTGQAAAPPIVHSVLAASGEPLDPATRGFVEPRFGHDFSRVRVHAGEQAAESADQLQARAYTVGNHVVFGDGQYAPRTTPGLALIAHELTHVLQQGATGEPGVLQRERAPNAKGWTGAPAKCGSDFCQPLPSWRDAKEERHYLWPALARGIKHKVSSRVLPLWMIWAYGGSSSVLDLTEPFGADFTGSYTTLRTSEVLMSSIKARLAASPPTVPPGAGPVKVDISTLIPAEVRAIDDPTPGSPTAMNFNVIGDFAGNVAGGIGKDQAATPIGAKPSPQDDQRIAKGTVELFDSGPTLTAVPHLSYTVKDTVDLCPGDCGSDLEQKATVIMSQWEASGISGDVPFTVDFPAPGYLLAPFAVPKPPPVSP